MQRSGKRKGGLVEQDLPTAFGEQTTGDTLLDRRHKKKDDNYVEDDNLFPGAKTAVVLYDRGTKWLDCCPKATKSAEDTKAAMQFFAGTDEIKSFYSDNAHELEKAAKELGWMRASSTPGVPQTNGLAERMVRKTKEMSRANIVQGGQHASWWEYAAPCGCFTRNTAGGHKSPYYLRHGVESNHLNIPYGAQVDFMPTPNPNKTPAPFESKTKVGILVGYHQQPGGKWSGDYLVAEFEPFRYNPDAKPKDVTVHRVKEVVPPKRLEPIHFPLADYRKRLREIPEAVPNFDPAPTGPVLPEPSAPSSGKPDGRDSGEPEEAFEPPTDDLQPVTVESLDVRGKGTESFDGKRVQPRSGSTRPPNVHPEVWSKIYTHSNKKAAIKTYIDGLREEADRINAERAAAASSSSGNRSPAAPAPSGAQAEKQKREQAKLQRKALKTFSEVAAQSSVEPLRTNVVVVTKGEAPFTDALAKTGGGCVKRFGPDASGSRLSRYPSDF